MEKRHRAKLNQAYGSLIRAKKVVCLDIPDEYDFMAPALIELLERKVSQHLGHGSRPLGAAIANGRAASGSLWLV